MFWFFMSSVLRKVCSSRPLSVTGESLSIVRWRGMCVCMCVCKWPSFFTKCFFCFCLTCQQQAIIRYHQAVCDSLIWFGDPSVMMWRDERLILGQKSVWCCSTQGWKWQVKMRGQCSTVSLSSCIWDYTPVSLYDLISHNSILNRKF